MTFCFAGLDRHESNTEGNQPAVREAGPNLHCHWRIDISSELCQKYCTVLEIGRVVIFLRASLQLLCFTGCQKRRSSQESIQTFSSLTRGKVIHLLAFACDVLFSRGIFVLQNSEKVSRVWLAVWGYGRFVHFTVSYQWAASIGEFDAKANNSPRVFQNDDNCTMLNWLSFVVELQHFD